MSRDKRHLLLTAFAMCAACALMATPALADDGKGGGGGRSGGGGGGDNHARVTTSTTTTTTSTVAEPRDDRGRGDDRPKPAANTVPRVVHVEHEAEHEVEHAATPGVPAVVNVAVDNDHDRDDRGPGNAVDQDDNRGPGNARDRDNDEVAALQIEEVNEVNEVNEVDLEHLRVVSLATLTAGLSAADAATLTDAVNARTAALQMFLGSGGTNATVIDNALNAINIAPSSVLAILGEGEHLVVVTA